MKSLLGLEQDRKCTVRTLSPCLVAYVQQIAFFVILVDLYVDKNLKFDTP